MLQENKNNIKEMWKVLRNVMGNKVISSCPQYLINEQNKEIQAEEMADEFNSFFCQYWAKSCQIYPFTKWRDKLER